MNDIYGFFIKNNMYIINPFNMNNIISLKKSNNILQDFVIKKDINNLQQLIKCASFNKQIIDQQDIIDSQVQIKQLYKDFRNSVFIVPYEYKTLACSFITNDKKIIGNALLWQIKQDFFDKVFNQNSNEQNNTWYFELVEARYILICVLRKIFNYNKTEFTEPYAIQYFTLGQLNIILSQCKHILKDFAINNNIDINLIKWL